MVDSQSYSRNRRGVSNTRRGGDLNIIELP
jgi:hypothetical protein